MTQATQAETITHCIGALQEQLAISLELYEPGTVALHDDSQLDAVTLLDSADLHIAASLLTALAHALEADEAEYDALTEPDPDDGYED